MYEQFGNSLGGKIERIVQDSSIKNEIVKTESNEAINKTELLNGIRSLAHKKSIKKRWDIKRSMVISR